MIRMTLRCWAGGLLALATFGCRAEVTQEASAPRWQQTRDGLAYVADIPGYPSITRCWRSDGDLIIDCVWVGGFPSTPGEETYTAERWFNPGISPKAGPPDPPQDGSARFSCHLTYRAGRLDGVHQILTFKGGELKNERWLQTRDPGEGWSEPDILQWSERADTPLSSPLLDCEKLGRLIQTGGWHILGTNQWTGPNSWAADGLATLTP